MINGILWRTENGAKWHQVPERYGPRKTCYHRFSQWESDGTWARMEQRLQAQADAAGELDWRAQPDAPIVRDDVPASRAHKGSRGGRPPNFNAVRYKDRNHVERGFGRLKQFRAVATRYDKLEDRYQATVTVASIMVWLPATRDRKSP